MIFCQMTQLLLFLFSIHVIRCIFLLQSQKKRQSFAYRPSLSSICFLFALHFLYNLQPREFFPFLFFQCVIDRIYQIAVHRDSNIFKRIGTLLGLLDVRRQPVCRILDHRQLDGQIGMPHGQYQ